MNLEEELSRGLSKKEIKGLLEDYYVNRFDTEHLLLRYQVPLSDIQKYVLEGATETYYGGLDIAGGDFDESILLFVAKAPYLASPKMSNIEQQIWIDKEEERLFDQFWGTQDFRANFLDRARHLEETEEWKQFEIAIENIASKANGDPSVLGPYFICKNIAFLYTKLFLFANKLETVDESLAKDDFSEEIRCAESNLKRIFSGHCAKISRQEYNPAIFKRFMKELISLKGKELEFSPQMKESLLYRAIKGAPKSPEVNRFRVRLLTIILNNAGVPLRRQEMSKHLEDSLDNQLKGWLNLRWRELKRTPPSKLFNDDALLEYVYFQEVAGASPLITREEILNVDEEYEKIFNSDVSPLQTKEEAYAKITELVCDDFDIYLYTLDELNAIYQILTSR